MEIKMRLGATEMDKTEEKYMIGVQVAVLNKEQYIKLLNATEGNIFTVTLKEEKELPKVTDELGF